MEVIYTTGASTRLRKALIASLLAASAVAASACGSGSPSNGAQSGKGGNLPSAEVLAGNKDELSVALSYIAMKNPSGTPAATQADAQAMVDHMNSLWSQCNIDFRMVSYRAVDPSELGARFNPANYSELDAMREMVQNQNEITMIGTGTWDRAGDLGNNGSNCYSSFPGDQADGIVCEWSQAAAPVIHGHEVGHWLNLYHTDDPSADYVDDTTGLNSATNLMNHFVAPENTYLTAGQCARARMSIGTSRRAAVL